jgi:C-terminal processing protease CtpA/Prc
MVTDISDDAATQAGVKVGDIVLKVEGEDIVARFKQRIEHLSASTDPSLGHLAMRRIANGPVGSDIHLTLRTGSGETREVALKCGAQERSQRTGDKMRILPGKIGYMDLERIGPAEIDSLLERLRDTKAIVFDLRGPTGVIASQLASRLTAKPAVAAAIVTGPISLTPDVPQNSASNQSASYFFVEPLLASDKWRYEGKTVALIDERTQGEAERTGLFLEVAGTEFIGSPSAGANGAVAEFRAPGGIRIRFSGQEVRHANGGQLQRLGLQPTVAISPTLTGIRSGRDEALDKAVEYLRASLDEPASTARLQRLRVLPSH